MDSSRFNCIQKAISNWCVEHGQDLPLDLHNIDSACITLEIRGQILQISVPSWYTPGVPPDQACAEMTEAEPFLITSPMGRMEGWLERSLAMLNEKLERIKYGKDALCQVFDALQAAVKSKKILKAKFVCEGSSEEEDGADSNTEEEEDDEDGDLSCYDMAGEEELVGLRELAQRNSAPIQQAASEAADICQLALKKVSETGVEVVGRHLESLQWCAVETDLRNLKVWLQIDIGGVVNDVTTALAVGLRVDVPMKVGLTFKHSQWVHSNVLLEPEAIKATQGSLWQGIRVEDADNGNQVDNDDLLGKLEVASYGLDVLLPELVRIYLQRADSKPLQVGSVEGVNSGIDSSGAARGVKRGYTASTAPWESMLHCTDGDNQRDGRRTLSCTAEIVEPAIDDNIFVDLLLFLCDKLRTQAEWCAICFEALPFPSGRLRPCTKELCLYKFEELGLGSAVLSEVRDRGSLVELELSLAAAAAEGWGNVFEPFPSFLLRESEMRGRAGWFSQPSVPGAKREKLLDRSARQEIGEGSANKNLRLLKELISSIPSIEDLQKSKDEAALQKVVSKEWIRQQEAQSQAKLRVDKFEAACGSRGSKDTLASVHGAPASHFAENAQPLLPYKVLRFILSTNRLTMRCLEKEEELGIPGTLNQFVVLSDSPEREAIFNQKRAKSGSFFAFHGSRGGNWYSILRNGLRTMSGTQFMSSGAAYGSGIYLSPKFAFSRGYSREPTYGCSKGKYKSGFICMAICEVIDGATCVDNGSILVVDPEKDEEVIIRYLLVLHLAPQPDSPEIVQQRLLKSAGSTCDLGEHLRSVRDSWQLDMQQKRGLRRELRRKALVEIARKAKTALQDEWVGAASTSMMPFGKEHGSTAATQDRPGTSISRSRSIPVQATASATHAIQKEYRKILHLQEKGNSSFARGALQLDLPEEDNLYLWRIMLRPILFTDSALASDLALCARQRQASEVPVVLEIIFPGDFPFKPPFVRVVGPRFEFRTGHVTTGGSICMELLTESGWSPAYTLESLLVTIMADMQAGDARLDYRHMSTGSEYTMVEAREAFLRAARTHGWKV